MKPVLKIFIILMCAANLSVHAVTEKVYEGHVQCSTNAAYSVKKPELFQDYTPEIPIYSTKLNGKTCYIPVGYKSEYKGNFDFFYFLIDNITTRADQIMSTAPKASKAETLLHIAIVSTGTKATILGDAEAGTYLQGSKIIGEPFDIVDETGNVLAAQCYLLAVKKEGLTQTELTNAIDWLYTASIGTPL